jgi:hypothetical protein
VALKVVGAGLGRTGTNSLKLALEHLLGKPCYHMWEVFSNPEHAPVWTAALRGTAPDWDDFLSGYGATIDFPAAAFWPELMEAYPNALVLLSVRDTDAWWKSCARTIFSTDLPPPPAPMGEMIDQMWASRFTTNIADEAAAKKAYESFNNKVRQHVPADRLLEWQPGDGWEPICAALGMEIPVNPFPHVNSSADFLHERGPESGATAGFKAE